jgi:hypothetical protein
MNRRTWILPALSLLLVGPGQASAASIAGPSSFTVVGGGDSFWGLQFTALQASTLTGFDYNHRAPTFGNPISGTISLNDVTSGTTVYSATYGVNVAQVIAFAPNVALRAGDVYQLVASSTTVLGGNDEVYSYIAKFGGTAPNYTDADTDIAITQGAFSSGGFQNSAAWGAFTNIATQSGTNIGIQSVPEPASVP